MDGMLRLLRGFYGSRRIPERILEAFSGFARVKGLSDTIRSPKNENAKHPVQLILTAQVFLFRGTFVETSTRPFTGNNKQ